MSNKEISFEVQKNIVPDNNLASRLLGKMLEDQGKKIKEIRVVNPSRISHKIVPKDNKMNSVLSNLKKQVIDDENSRIINQARRSPGERDLQLSSVSNLPVLIEKEKNIQRRSPVTLSKKSENSIEDNQKINNNLNRQATMLNTPDTDEHQKINKVVKRQVTILNTPENQNEVHKFQKDKKTSGSTPPKLRGEFFKNNLLNINLNSEESIDDKFNQINLKTQETETNTSNDDNTAYRVTESALRNSGNFNKIDEIKIVDDSAKNLNPPKKGHIPLYYLIGKQVMNMKFNSNSNEKENDNKDKSDFLFALKEPIVHQSIPPSNPIRKKLKTNYHYSKFSKIFSALRYFVKIKKHFKKSVIALNSINYFFKKLKTDYPCQMLIKIQRKYRSFMDKKKEKKANESQKLMEKQYLNNLEKLKLVLRRSCHPNPINILRINRNKHTFSVKLQKIILVKSLRYYFMKLKFFSKLNKIIERKTNFSEKTSFIKYFFIWKKKSLFRNYNEATKTIQRFWLYKRIRRFTKVNLVINKLFLAKRNLHIFRKLFLFAKLGGQNKLKNYLNNLCFCLRKHEKKAKDLKKFFLQDWKVRSIRLKLKNAINMIIFLMRKNSQLKAKLKSYEKINYLADIMLQKKKNHIFENLRKLMKAIKILNNPKRMHKCYGNTIVVRMLNKSEFADKNIKKIQRCFRHNKIKKLNQMINLAKFQKIAEFFKKIYKRISLNKIKSTSKFHQVQKILKMLIINRSINKYFLRLKKLINVEKEKILYFFEVIKKFFMKKIIKKLCLLRLCKVFRNLDNKYKNILDKHKSIWKINIFKDKYNTTASLIIRNWRPHRVRKVAKCCRLIKLALRLIYMRKFLYDAKRNKFFKQMLYLCKKMKNKEFNNLKDKYNTWKDECVFKKEVYVLKSGRKPVYKHIMASLIKNSFYMFKLSKNTIALNKSVKLQRLVQIHFLRKKMLKFTKTQNISIQGITDLLKRSLALRNIIKQNYFKKKEDDKDLLIKFFKIYFKNSKFIPNENKIPVIKPSISTCLSTIKRMIINPINASLKLGKCLKIVGQIKSRKIKKIQEWFKKFVQRNGFKTLRIILPRTDSLNKIIQFTDMKIKQANFFKLLIKIRKIVNYEMISKIISIKKIQKFLKKKIKKHKISLKLLNILNLKLVKISECLLSKFIFWMKHMHFAKLTKAIKIVIQLMKQNSVLKLKNSCREKIMYFAFENLNLKFRKLLGFFKVATFEKTNHNKANLFLQRIYFKESYKFIEVSKTIALKNNRFKNILISLYKKYDKSILRDRFRQWSYFILNYEIFTNKLGNCKSFFNSIMRKEAKKFTVNLRLFSGRSLKLSEIIIKLWTNDNLNTAFLKWFQIMQHVKKYTILSDKFLKIFDRHNKRISWNRLVLKNDFRIIFPKLFDSHIQSQSRSKDYHFNEFMNRLQNFIFEKSKFFSSIKSEFNSKIQVRKIYYNKHTILQKPSNCQIHVYRFFSQVIQFILLQNCLEKINHSFKLIENHSRMKFNYKIKFKSLQQLIDNKFKRRIYNNINHICIGDKIRYYFQSGFRKIELKKTIIELSKLRDRIRAIDLLETTKTKISLSTNKFVFAKLFKSSLRLNKCSKFFLDYFSRGAEMNYLISLVENNNNFKNHNNREILINSFSKGKNKLSYYSPGENLFIRNIYSYKWWQPKSLNEAISEEKIFSQRNIYQYIEGFSLKEYYNDIIDEKRENMSLICETRSFRDTLREDISMNYEIMSKKKPEISINIINSFEIAPLPKKIDEIVNVNNFEVECDYDRYKFVDDDCLMHSTSNLHINQEKIFEPKIEIIRLEICGKEKAENLLEKLYEFEIHSQIKFANILENVNWFEIHDQSIKIDNVIEQSNNFEIEHKCKFENEIELVNTLEIQKTKYISSIETQTLEIENLIELVCFLKINGQKPEELVKENIDSFEIEYTQKEIELILQTVNSLEINQHKIVNNLIILPIEIEILQSKVFIENSIEEVSNLQIKNSKSPYDYLDFKLFTFELLALPKDEDTMELVNIVEIIQSKPESKVFIDNVNSIQLNRLIKVNSIALENVLEILKKIKPLHTIQTPSKMTFYGKEKKIQLYDYDIEEFTIYADVARIKKLEREAEEKQKVLLRKKWIENQFIRRELNIQILKKEEDKAKINPILATDENKLDEDIITFNTKVYDSNQFDETKRNFAIIKPEEKKTLGNLKISIKKKEEISKPENKFDVFGKLGQRKSKLMLNNILNNVESKIQLNKNDSNFTKSSVLKTEIIEEENDAMNDPNKDKEILKKINNDFHMNTTKEKKMINFPADISHLLSSKPKSRTNFGNSPMDKSIKFGHSLLKRINENDSKDLTLREEDVDEDKFFNTTVNQTPKNLTEKMKTMKN